MSRRGYLQSGDRYVHEEMLRLGAAQGDSGLRTFCLMALGICGPPSAAKEVRAIFETDNDPGIQTAAAAGRLADTRSRLDARGYPARQVSE